MKHAINYLTTQKLGLDADKIGWLEALANAQKVLAPDEETILRLAKNLSDTQERLDSVNRAIDFLKTA